MLTDFPTVITVEGAATLLATTPEAIVRELEAGRLRGFQVDGGWRTSMEALSEFVGRTAAPSPESEPPHPLPSDGAAVASDPPDSPVEWRPTDLFGYQWPESFEQYEEAYEGGYRVAGRVVPLRIGFTNRDTAGKADRRRAVVFLDKFSSLHPLVEFAGANDFESSGMLASVIKLGDGKHLRPGAPIPDMYRGMKIGVYSEVVVGPYAAKSLAVLARKDDFRTMSRHAVIRGLLKGLIDVPAAGGQSAEDAVLLSAGRKAPAARSRAGETASPPIPGTGHVVPGEGLRRAFGAWSDDAEELDRYLEWNRQQRKVGRPGAGP